MDIQEIIEHKEALIFATLEESIDDLKEISNEMETHLSLMNPDDPNFDKLSVLQDKLRYIGYYTGSGMYYAASCVKALNGQKPTYFVDKGNFRAVITDKVTEKKQIIDKVSDLRDKLAILMQKYPDRFSMEKNRPKLIEDSIRILDTVEEKLYEIIISHAV